MLLQGFMIVIDYIVAYSVYLSDLDIFSINYEPLELVDWKLHQTYLGPLSN